MHYCLKSDEFSSSTYCGSVVVKTLGYKSEGPGIDSRCSRFFFRDNSIYPEVDSAS